MVRCAHDDGVMMARMKRLALHVSPAVAEALEQYADRLDPDRICDEALQQRIQVLRDAEQERDVLGAAVARYRAQKADMRSAAKAAGFRDGRGFILERASYETARLLESLYKRNLSGGLEGLSEELAAVVRDEYGALPVGGAALDEGEWTVGFVEGAMDAWLRIRSEVEA